MDKATTLKKINDLGLLAVIRGPSKGLTLQMVAALVRAGILGIEITYTTPQAAEVLRACRDRYGEEIVLGMGTLTQPAQAREAAEAGATFLVSPHTEPELARAMTDTGLPVMMGALTPTEVVQSYRLGSDVVKLFPASLGGPAYLKALRGPFPDIPLMPTSGVSEKNLKEWFAAGAFAVGAGSNLCPKELAVQGRFDEITAIAHQFALAVQAARTS